MRIIVNICKKISLLRLEIINFVVCVDSCSCCPKNKDDGCCNGDKCNCGPACPCGE
jgi:hypothetical protein